MTFGLLVQHQLEIVVLPALQAKVFQQMITKLNQLLAKKKIKKVEGTKPFEG